MMMHFHNPWVSQLPVRLLLVGILLALVISVGALVFRPAGPHTAAALSPQFVTIAQRAAIAGGEDLLLLSDPPTAHLYLPMINK